MLLDICGKYLNFTPEVFWHPGSKFQLCLPGLDPAWHFKFNCLKQNANTVRWVPVAHLSGLHLSIPRADNGCVTCTSVQHSCHPWLWRRDQKTLDHADQGTQLCSSDTGEHISHQEMSHSRGLYGLQLLQSTFTPFMAFISLAYSWEAKDPIKGLTQAIVNLGFQPCISNPRLLPAGQSPNPGEFWTSTILGCHTKGSCGVLALLVPLSRTCYPSLTYLLWEIFRLNVNIYHLQPATVPLQRWTQ